MLGDSLRKAKRNQIMAKNQKINAQFNTKTYTFDKPSLKRAVSKAVKAQTPRSADNLKHRIYLPGVKVPVSIGWAVLNLLGVKAVGVSENGNAKGAYHPAQALSTFAKFAPLGVRVESDATSPKYVKYSEAARKLFSANTKKTSAKKTSKKTSAKR